MTDPQPANTLAQHIAAEVTTAANEVNAAMSVLRSELEKWAAGLGQAIHPKLQEALAAIGNKAIEFNQTVNKVTAPAGTVTGFPGHPLNFAEIQAQGGDAIPAAPVVHVDEPPKIGDVVVMPIDAPHYQVVDGTSETPLEPPHAPPPEDTDFAPPREEGAPEDEERAVNYHDHEPPAEPPVEHDHSGENEQAPEEHPPTEPDPLHAI